MEGRNEGEERSYRRVQKKTKDVKDVRQETNKRWKKLF